MTPTGFDDLAYEIDIARLLPAIGARVKALTDGDANIVLAGDVHVRTGLAGQCAEARRGLLVDAGRAMAQPLLIRGELLGVITVTRPAGHPPFTAADLARLEGFAGHAALALRNATLYREAEQRRRAAEELARMARGLSHRQDAESVGKEIVRSVLAVFDVYACIIRRLRPDGGLEAIASNLYEVGHVQPAGIGLSARALAEGRAVWTPDLVTDPRLEWNDDFRRRNAEAGPRAALVVPMRTESGIVGVFQMSSPVVRQFSAHEVELAQAFADQAALALESARLHRDIGTSEERTRMIVDTALDAVVIIDGEGRITGWNAQAERTFGWSSAEVLGHSLGDTIVPPRYRPAHEEGLRRYRQSGHGPVVNRRLEISALHRSGREFPVELSISPIITSAGIEFSGFIRDITDRKQAEALVTLLQQVAVAANEAPSPRAALQIVIDQVCEYTGWPVGNAMVLAEDGSGDLVSAFAAYRDQPERFRPFQETTDRTRFHRGIGLPGRVLETGRAAWIMDVTRDPNFPRALAAEESGVKAAFGFPVLAGTEVVAVLEFFTGEAREPDRALLDVMANIGTQLGRVFERHRAQVELHVAKDAAETASRAKSAFLAHMSHELRTPLNAILGYAQVIARDAELPPPQRKALGIIEGSGEHLLSLINEILDLAKIEAGTIEMQPAPFALRDLVEGVADLMRPRAEAKGLAFTGEWPEDLPAVRADEKRIRQVLVNLLDNAIKHTTEGGVVLRVDRLPTGARFLVEDTGVGIPPEDLARIFESFHQVRDPQRSIEGTGLGLAISKTLVTLMGGQLEVSSEAGAGSRFWFELPLPEVSAVGLSTTGARPAIVGVRGERRRLLVVDDKDDNRQLLRDLLGPVGFEIVEASDAYAGLALALEARPDAVLIDLRMPGMDGLEATRRLRAMEATRQLVIIAVSASAFDENREKCLEAGADDFIAKPFRLPRLLELLCAHLGLTLVYDDTADARVDSAATDAATPLVPPAAALDTLLDLARRGNVTQIVEEARRLATADARFGAFVAEVSTLAERFQVKKLCQMLEAARAGR